MDSLVVVEEFKDLFVCLIAESAEEVGYRHFASSVDSDGDDIGGVGLEFNPCAAVGDNGGVVERLACGIDGACVVGARRPHEL